MTPGVNCKARATVLKILNEENRVFQYILANHDVSHQCEPNKPKMIAEKMKHDMKLRVRSNPSDPVMATILEVREEAANIYGNDEELFNKITYELGANRPIVKQLLRARHDVIGKTPQNRNEFNVNEFMKNVFGESHGIEIMDSNNISENWRQKIDVTDSKTNFKWDLEESVQCYENENNCEFENDCINQDIVEEIINENSSIHYESNEKVDLSSKDLPKRVLAFSTKNLLKLLHKHLRTSVDGTFKSNCFLWAQQFRWSAKISGYWIPIIWGWLPDKSLTSYKVNIYFN